MHFPHSSARARGRNGGKRPGRHLWNVSVPAISSVGKNVPFLHSPGVTMPTPAARAHPPPLVVVLKASWCLGVVFGVGTDSEPENSMEKACHPERHQGKSNGRTDRRARPADL